MESRFITRILKITLVLVMLVVLHAGATLFVKADSKSIPSEACSYSLHWTDEQGNPPPVPIPTNPDNPTVNLKSTLKANLVFDGSGCRSFSTRFKGTSPSGEFFNNCIDVTPTIKTLGASVYFDKEGRYVVSASVHFSSNCSPATDQKKNVQITAWAQPAIVVISEESASVTDKTAVITWKTDQASEGTVWLRQKNDPSKGEKAPATSENKVSFSGLSPNTDYIYTVYATTDGWKTNATGSDHAFKTNAPGNKAPTNSSEVIPSPGEDNPTPVPTINIPDSLPVKSVPNYDEPADKNHPGLIGLINVESVPEFFASLLKFILLAVSGFAIIIILIGSFRMAMSQGKTEALTAAKKTITWAIIGLVVALLSYSIVAVLQGVLGI